MGTEITMMNENLLKLARDIELIKNILLSEGQLTPWAKKELAKARQLPDSEYITLDAMEQRISRR